MANDQIPSDIITAIQGAQDGFSPKLTGVAGYALDNPAQFIRNTSKVICAELKISEPTLIKFCQHFGYSGLSDFRIDFALSLAQQGNARRFVEPLPNDRRKVNLAGKLRIARCAIDVVREDQSLLIDNGSTAERFAVELGQLPEMTVMTNGILVAENALAHGTHTVMLTGGRIRPNSMSMSGPMAATCLQQMRFDTFVMSAASIDPEFGLSAFLEDEAQVTRQMMQAAGRVVVLADKTKLLKPAMHLICQTAQIDVLITDLRADDPVITTIEAHGVQVICATDSKENFNESD